MNRSVRIGIIGAVMLAFLMVTVGSASATSFRSSQGNNWKASWSGFSLASWFKGASQSDEWAERQERIKARIADWKANRQGSDAWVRNYRKLPVECTSCEPNPKPTSQVPEPAAALLFGLGAIVVGRRVRRS